MSSSRTPLRLAVIGAGDRGRRVYAGYCLAHPDQARVVAVAEPDGQRRGALAREHGIPPERCVADWRTLLAQPRDWDAAVVATPDREHVGPAVAALDSGADVLLEKPIAPTVEEVERLADAAGHAAGTVTVAHVLRYTPFFATLKALVDEGRVGRLVNIQHIENIGFWHFAHSYVRGNWRRADQASPMILTKACHDLDLLRWLAEAPCSAVASSGDLVHFTAANRPPGAPDYCLDGCPVADDCPFHAGRFYLQQLDGHHGWPRSVLGGDADAVAAALRHGPYGRCVYDCDNDVADHQSTLLEFANGVVATLTVSAFTRDATRTVRLMGTRGELRGHLDRGEIEVRAFLPPRDRPTGVRLHADSLSHSELLRVRDGAPPGGPLGTEHGHAGGDEGLMRDFVDRLRRRRQGQPPAEAATSLSQSLDSHRMAFAAEASRRTGARIRLGRDRQSLRRNTTMEGSMTP